MKSNFWSGAAGVLLAPLCVTLMTTGCTTDQDIPVPPDAYVAPEQEPGPAKGLDLSTPAPEEKVVADDASAFEFTIGDEPSVFEEFYVEEQGKPQIELQKPSASAPAKEEIVYVVRKGDNLSKIAKANNTTVAAIASLNSLDIKKPLRIGQKLRVQPGTAPAAKKEVKPVDPSAKTYTVKSGDTLGGIAWRYSVKTAELASVNGLDVKKPIIVGQKLVLPANAKERPASAKTAKTTKAPAKKTSSAPKKASDIVPIAPSDKPVAPAADTAMDVAAAENGNADALLSGIESPDGGVAAPKTADVAPAVPSTGSIDVAPQGVSVDPDNMMDFPLSADMTLEEVAKSLDRNLEVVKAMNPGVDPKMPLKAGTVVKLPIF